MTKQQENPEDFSLVVCGPLYHFYLRAKLVKPAVELYKRRAFVIVLFAWLPLLILSFLGGTAFTGVSLPFISDFDTHIRLLLVLTMLISAEVVVHKLIQLTVAQFIKSHIVTEQKIPQYNNIIKNNMQLRNSVIVEVSLLALVYTLGHWIWNIYTVHSISAWYGVPGEGIANLTAAGIWYAFVSLPLFQFILLRWYFRIFVWYRFLWQVSRMSLNLNSLHPDRAGGLGFLAYSAFAFIPFLLAHTVLVAGIIANRILYNGAFLSQFKLEVVGIIVYLLILGFLPLTFFCLHMARAKRMGSFEYGNFASSYVNAFRSKWFDAKPETMKDMLGTQDIQALADLDNSFQVDHEMSFLPLSPRVIIRFAIIISLPFIPLLLTIIPIEEIVGRLVKIIF